MKEFLKFVYLWAARFLKTSVSLMSILLFNKFKVSKKINKLNVERAVPVSIIGGGPSANDILSNRTDLLHGTELLVVNYFGNTDFFFIYKPCFYILLDPAFFDANYVNIGLNENGPKTRPGDILLMENFKKVDWPMMLFIPYKSGRKDSFERRVNNPNINIIEYHSTRIDGFGWFKKWMFHHSQGLPNSRNVVIPAMILMANIGYKKIYLYGCEFSWTKTMDVNIENGQVFFNDHHFYSTNEIRYFGKGGYKWWLEAIVEMLKATDEVAQYAKYENVKIVNRTKGSFVDSFEYENPDRIMC